MSKTFKLEMFISAISILLIQLITFYFLKEMHLYHFFKLNIQRHSYLLVFIVFKQSQRSKKNN